jgi:hypothetical protein
MLLIVFDINDELTKLLNDILREKFNDIDQQFTDKKNSIVEKLPHLAEYVKNIKNLILFLSRTPCRPNN